MRMALSIAIVTLSLLSILAFFSLCRADTRGLYVRPTESNSENVSCPAQTSSDCHTLNDWIENGTSPFMNNTVVVLLPGIHRITSRNERVFIENVTSLEIVGQQRETVIYCVQGTSFEFFNVVNVSIAFVEFESCTTDSKTAFDIYQPLMDNMLFTLLFVRSANIQVNGVTIKDGGIIVTESVSGSNFIVKESEIISDERGFFYSSFAHLKCPDGVPLEIVYILDSNATILMSKSPCTKLDLRRVSITNTLHFDFALSVHALWLVLTDVVLYNNSSPLLTNIGASFVDVNGKFVISSNIGDEVYFTKGHIRIHPGTQIDVTNNRFRYNGLSFSNCASFNILSNDDNGLVTVLNFQNNTNNEGGVFFIVNADPLRVNRVRINNTKFTFVNNTSIGFDDDRLSAAGIMFLENSVVKMKNSAVRFVANRSPLSGGLTMIKTVLDATNISAEFIDNHGSDGGGLSLYEESTIFFNDYCFWKFCHNTASRKGGAIFVEDSDNINTQTKKANNMRALMFLGGIGVNLQLSGDKATVAGNEVYGGWIDIFDDATRYNTSRNDSGLSTVASNPTRVCLCINSVPDCTITEHQIAVFPGEMFEAEAVAVGQRFGVVPSIVIPDLREKGILYKGQDVQSVGKECTTLEYKVHSLNAREEITLKAQDLGVPKLDYLLIHLPLKYHILFKQFSIIASLKRCPIGFTLDTTLRECTCSQTIKLHKKINCNFSSYTITRAKGAWLGARLKNNQTEYYDIVIHDHCPYDYCRTDIDSMILNLESSDKQCAHGRTGVLCGRCKANHSQVLGTARCKLCSQTMLPVIILASITAGISLVGFLMVLNLTVSSGYINGIIFYANVIRMSQTAFYPTEIGSSSTFLATFIAWLNLDLGIETCFYDGLDAYDKTWLQFVFPTYIWVMVITVIISSHYSSRASKVFSNNSVQVLATLFLLSYVKILRTIVTVLSYTTLTYSDGSTERVWLYDGNVKYLEGKHIPLFIASFLLLILLSVFYTLPLVVIQWLQKFSHYRILCWINRLMPLLDAYTGPYKFKHRYWTGSLLLVRVVFLIIFSFNISNNPAVNLLTIAVVTFTLLVYISFVQVYKSWVHNALEIASLFNLSLLSVVTFYQMATEGRITLSTNLSTGITFGILSLLVFHHSFKRLLSSRMIKRMSMKIRIILRKKRVHDDSNDEVQNGENIIVNELTHTSVELCEPLVQH